MPTLYTMTAVAALALVGLAAVTDVIRWQIPDWISIVVVVLAAVFGVAAPDFAWWSHTLAPCLMFGFGLLAFSRGWLGGGDVKLMTAVAAWTGVSALPIVFVAIAVAGGVLTLIITGWHRARRRAPTTHVPYAVAIAAGTLWWLAASGGGPLGGLHPIGDQRPVPRASAT